MRRQTARILNPNTAEALPINLKGTCLCSEPIRVCKSVENTTDAARWYASQTHALQEDRAAENVNAWRVETFAPKYKERRSNAFTGRPVYFTRSLFPRYMFARFDAARMLRKVWFTRGVAKVVGFGDGPSPVDDSIIELIKSRVGEDGFIQFDEELKRGTRLLSAMVH